MKQLVLELAPADGDTFQGDAFTRLLGGAESSVPIKIYYVRFEPGARTRWHAHSGVQLLVVTSGRCRYRITGGPVLELGPGESVRFDAGVRHWHGAVDDQPAEHIAVNLDSRETDWLEEVTDDQYRGSDG